MTCALTERGAQHVMGVQDDQGAVQGGSAKGGGGTGGTIQGAIQEAIQGAGDKCGLTPSCYQFLCRLQDARGAESISPVGHYGISVTATAYITRQHPSDASTTPCPFPPQTWGIRPGSP